MKKVEKCEFQIQVLALVIIMTIAIIEARQDHDEMINRNSFPLGFTFGAGSSAYQYEGAAFIDGKGPSMWDTFVKLHPEKIADHKNGSVAEDFYHRYEEDIALMKQLGFDSLRLSISWSRVLPKGKMSKGVNKQGVDFYNNLINCLLSHGIQPFVSLVHGEPPQALEDEYGGFLSPKIVEDFVDYAEFCFKEFGDRVKYWVTINEPNVFAANGYATSTAPPCRCSDYISEDCKVGNSGTEPYIVAHHELLCHAYAVKLYRDNHQNYQNGKIGISVPSEWKVPKYNTTSCIKAALRSMDFQFGWIFDPVTYGDYPQSMRSIVGNRLPKFTKAQSQLLKGSSDFLGLNYYYAYYAEDANFSTNLNFSYTTDSHVNLTKERNGIPLGEPTSYPGYYIYPRGIRELVLYVKRRYKNPLIFITENGLFEARNNSLSIEDALNDESRISFHRRHLSFLLKAIKEDGANVGGYYLWSFLDAFEWSFGYEAQLGINYVDFNNGLKRYTKSSAIWFQKFLLQNNKQRAFNLIKQLRTTSLLKSFYF